MRELEKGVESVDFNVDGPYEVEHLSHSVQSMISTMRHLMEDVLRQEEEKRRSELDVLQSQINPHFLYNTLDSVVWMTENGRTQEAVVMLTALARFFRISLSKGSNIIPIGDEIEHARNYLTIQKMRYKNKFSADISVEPGVEKLYTIKLIIQPILENAIYHGMEYADGDGEIHIRAFREGETVVIEVEDNGPGMSEEIVEQLLKPTRDVSVPKAKGSGIGFRNVHQRIQLTFGNAYGLTIRSEPDNGTVVRICLPVLEEEDARKYRKEGGAVSRKVLLQLVLPLIGLSVLFWLLAFAPGDKHHQPALLEMSVILRDGDGNVSAMRKGMEQAAKDLNVELRFLTPAEDNSAVEQVQLLEHEVSGAAPAILLIPADREALGEAVSAAAGKTTLVTVESDMTAWGPMPLSVWIIRPLARRLGKRR